MRVKLRWSKELGKMANFDKAGDMIVLVYCRCYQTICFTVINPGGR